MSAELTVEALVLRRSDSGDSDRRLTLFSRQFGKIDVVAKGARKGGSRLAGSSEPLVHMHCQIAVGRQRRFLTQVQPITSFPSIRRDYDSLLAATALCELLLAILPWEGPEAEGFDELLESLRLLDQGASWGPWLAWMESRLLVQEGRNPDWIACVENGRRELDEVCWVSASAGGRISGEEAMRFGDRIRVSPHALIALDRLAGLDSPPKNLRPLDETLMVLHEFWQSHLDLPLRAGSALLDGLRASQSLGS